MIYYYLWLALPYIAAGCITYAVYRLEVMFYRWWQSRPKEHRVVHHWNPEIERENEWLRKQHVDLARKNESQKREIVLARREGKLEGYKECYFLTMDAGQHHIAKEINRRRQSM